MTKLAVAFHILEHGEKMDLRRKAQFVSGGHTPNPPVESNYADVVSIESVRIEFTIASLNDLDIFAADIQNTYLTAPCGEKIIFTCGPEFGSEHMGKQL